MERSIENIWKQGFLKNDVLIAPKLNDLYNQKSITLIDKLKRMMKINLYLVVVFAFINLAIYVFLGTPYAGVVIFAVLLGISWISMNQASKLENMDFGLNSYEYLLNFNRKLKEAVASMAEVMRYLYPILFLAAMMPIVHSLKESKVTSEAISNSGYHITYGIPTFGWGILFAITIVIFIFGKKIYMLDVNIVYKRIFQKIEEMIEEIEELRR